MLKWQGDFTLPRLRSKLANKYLMHPDVEPDYHEVYRPDLGQSVILKKTDSFSSFGGNSTMMSGYGDQRSLSRTSSNAFGSRTSLASSSDRRTLTRVQSVPSVGTRNLGRSPAVLEPLPPTLQTSPSATALKAAYLAAPREPSSPQVPTSPTSASPEDRRAWEKEQAAALASRRLWTYASGVEYNMKFELGRLAGEDPKPNNQQVLQALSKVPMSYMSEQYKAGGKIDWRNPEWDGGTLLLKAVRTDSRPLAMYCLGMQADPAVVDDSGRGVLHWAAVQGNPEMMDYFLTHYPELQVGAPDNGGDTPLHLSSYFGHLPIARLLIRADADPMVMNEHTGFTPIELAESRRAWDVSSYLMENRQHEDDRTNRETAQIKDLRRPCDLAQAARVRAAEMQNPKKPAKPPPKK